MIAVLFSGGKDSTLCSYLMESNGFDVCLVSFFPKNKYSYMLHSTAIEVTELQAKSMGKKYYKFEISGEKEIEVEEMLEKLKTLDIEGIASGAISSEYQKQRIDYMGEELGIPTYAPLWHKKLDEDYIEMEIIISKVSAMGLGVEELGKNALPLMEKYNYFEGGDAETLVLDAPFFEKRLNIEYEKFYEKGRGELKIKKAWLGKKRD